MTTARPFVIANGSGASGFAYQSKWQVCLQLTLMPDLPKFRHATDFVPPFLGLIWGKFRRGNGKSKGGTKLVALLAAILGPAFVFRRLRSSQPAAFLRATVNCELE